MGHNRLVKGAVYCTIAAGALTALLAGARPATAQTAYPTDKRHMAESVEICDFGAFFVGGVPKLTKWANSTVEGTTWQELIIGQMYVQFMIPKKQRGWPLIMVHGGGYTGSGLESTPDGNEGWFAYAVRNSLPTYVVDQAGRGRSGFDRSFINERIGTGNLANFPSLANTSASGIWTAWFGHLVPAGSDITNGTLIRHGDPGDPQCAANPAHCTFHPAHNFDAVDPDIEARRGAIGPAPLPANNRYLALEHYKWGVPNTNVTLPTSICATCTPSTVNPADTWSGQDLAKLVAGLGGAVVATHSQSGSVGHHMVRYLKDAGKLDKLKGLITIDGVGSSFASNGTTPADYRNIPYLTVSPYYPGLGDAGYRANVDAINAAGGRAEFLSLADARYGERFKGVTHMMMMGNGHLKVLDVILDWSSRNIRNQPKKNSCSVGRRGGGKDD
ncbi:MAG: hypothetical protein QOH59_3064 [Gemmatimonadales bacterium]|jgi:hypothetical protein|nr:hypothetical protein [Gemmatimonadales bacterium]